MVNSNPLMDIFNWSPSTSTANSTPMVAPKVQTQNQTLPNGGGTYNAAGKSTVTPAPIFTGVRSATPAPVVKPAASSFYDKYKDPKTGKIMTPEEYAIYLGNKVPKGNGEITNYAGDALSNQNQSVADLTARATDLNNSRNDIATGTTDPYKVGNQSGIAYSPAELKAIENAYAGVYDPALNDVFARLKETQAAEKAKTDLQQAKDLEVFKTNESIRQWRATTGTTPGATGGKSAKDTFTQTQLNNGASNAGLSLTTFDSLDDDIKNLYINPPMALDDADKKVPIYQNFQTYFSKIKSGEMKAADVSDMITSSTLPPAVKHYFIDQLPLDAPVKEGFFTKIWNAVTGK